MIDIARIYNPRRGRAHLADVSSSLTSTFCGIWPPDDWQGLGSLDEQDEAYRRTLCHRCYRRAVWRTT